MRKIIDTYAYGVEKPQGNRCQRWWEENPFGNKKRKIQRNSEVQDLDVKRFLSTFSLKCVEFGNWLQQGERYDHLLAAGYALHELSKLVGKNIGFDYNVGLAFGARGMRGAVAHFEAIERMINLTKQKGAGSLAHEYAHALDCMLGAHSDRLAKYSFLSGGHSVANSLKDNVNGDLRAYVNQIVDYVKTTDSYRKLYAQTLKKPYWHRRTEVFARFFEQYVAYKTNSINRYLCESWSDYTSNNAYLSEDEFMQILPVADKFARRVKDITSEDGLPAQKTPYPEPIIYKPKGQAKEEPKTVATKQPQDTKSTKNKTTSAGTVKAKINLYDFVDENNAHRIMRGVYHDSENRCAFAGDGYIYIANKGLYNPELVGKVIDKRGKELSGEYPDFRGLIDGFRKKAEIFELDIDDVIKFINHETKNIKNKENIGVKFLDVKYSFSHPYFPLNRLLLFAKIAKLYGKVYCTGNAFITADGKGNYCVLLSGNGKELNAVFGYYKKWNSRDKLIVTDKKQTISVSKEVKDAIMDRLMRHIDNGNYGLFSTYKENSKTPRILFQNKIEIDYSKGYKGTVKQNGKLIATIEGNFAKKKKDGMYKQLKPTVKYL